MRRYVARRVGASAVLLALTSVFIFVILRLIPGDPIVTMFGTTTGVRPAALAALRHKLGLDKSIPEQYLVWIKGIVLHGHFGTSYYNQYPVTTLIDQRLGPTIELAGASLLIALLIAVPAGLLSAMFPNSIVDRAVSGMVSAGLAFPPFVLGIILIVIFAVWQHDLPAQGFVPITQSVGRNAKLLVLPAVTLGFAASAPILRFIRASLREQLSARYVVTAEGKGLRWRQVVVRHAFPNALVPTITIVGVVVGYMLGGIVIIEYVFDWQGLGSLAVSAIQERDYAVLQGVVLLVAGMFILTSLVVDLACAAIDPRLRVALRRGQ